MIVIVSNNGVDDLIHAKEFILFIFKISRLIYNYTGSCVYLPGLKIGVFFAFDSVPVYVGTQLACYKAHPIYVN